jgi:hypothetical protein
MKKIITALVFTVLLATVVYTQKTGPKTSRTRPAAAAKPIPPPEPEKPAVDVGAVNLRTYTNQTFNFSVVFPNTWLIPGSDFEEYMKSQGYDVSLKLPPGLHPQAKTKIKQSTQRVTILLTAYKYMPGMADNAIVRIAVEDIKDFPQILDAVDYIDAMRESFKTIRLPGFKYSETQAEQLGTKQFAFIDTETKDDKRRLYATVRDGYAILFSITYTQSDDLAVLRDLLKNGDFALK